MTHGYASKTLTFRSFGALPWEVAVQGVIAGSALMAGTVLSKRVMLHLEPETFRRLLDGLMLAAGGALLWGAL